MEAKGRSWPLPAEQKALLDACKQMELEKNKEADNYKRPQNHSERIHPTFYQEKNSTVKICN